MLKKGLSNRIGFVVSSHEEKKENERTSCIACFAFARECDGDRLLFEMIFSAAVPI